MPLAILAAIPAGLLHVVIGPDHLSAVAPLSIDRGAGGWRQGAVWGVGHTLGVWIVGALAIALREVLPLEELSSWSERLVGVALIAIGLWALRRALRLRIHVHEHAHDGRPHAHIHLHGPTPAHESERAHRHSHVAVAFGLLHGLAGSAYFLGILPALALPTTGHAVAYVIAFGISTVAAMAAFAAVVGAIGTRFAAAGPRVYRLATAGAATAALTVGLIWLVG